MHAHNFGWRSAAGAREAPFGSPRNRDSQSRQYNGSPHSWHSRNPEMAYNGGAPNKRPRTDNDNFPTESNHSDEPRRKRADNPENSVLLYTIFNPAYPITTDVIHTISSPSGPVLRIVIFKKTGVQAMVEFDSIETARRAKDALNGADIYAGCCTLKIEFAKPTRLNVHKNDAESWDYTLNSDSVNKRPPPLLQEPRYGAAPQPYRPSDTSRGNFPSNNNEFAMANGSGGGGPGGGGGGFPAEDRPDRFSGERFKGGEMGGRDSSGGLLTARGPPFHGNPPTSGSVMMVYGLDMQRANCDRLFNLFCLYGNVARIKFLKTKEGSAMIQMGDGGAVERCVQYLNNTPLFGTQQLLQLGFSKQAYLADVQNPYVLPDGSPSYKDYIGAKHNRFSNPAMAVKNRIQGPSKILHFFNTPPNVDEETLKQLFQDKDLVVPSVKIFPMKSEKSSSGLLEFEEIHQAMEALFIVNHAAVDNPNGKFPYTMKLCFSSARHIPGQNGSSRHDD